MNRSQRFAAASWVDALETAVWVMGKAQLGRDLAKEELVDLRAFLESLTGKIPEDALRFPELPAKTSDGKTPSQSVPEEMRRK